MLKKIEQNLHSYVPASDLEWWQLFKKLFLLSLGFHLLGAFFSEGFHRPDEHLGMVRYMAFKMGIWNQADLAQVNWEYVAKIRPWLQPAFYYSWVKAFNFVGVDSPFILMFLLRLISSSIGILSLIPIAIFSYRLFSTSFSRKLALWLCFSLWFFPFFHARTTAENLGISLFILGITPLFLKFNKEDWLASSLSFNRERNLELKVQTALLSGLLLGSSFILRYQMIVMIGSTWLFLAIYSRVGWKTLFNILMGIIIMQGLGHLIDYWGYGEWTLTPWNYFEQNILKGKASGFGVSPWYYYFTKSLVKAVPPLSMALFLPFFWLWLKKPLHLLTWITLPYLIIHSLIGHKELRFIFALSLFIPLIVPYATEKFYLREKLEKKRWLRFLLHFMVGQNIILIFIASLKPAYSPISFYRHLYAKEQPIEKIYTLSVFRDQLKFYLKKPYKEIMTEDITMIPGIIDSSKGENWFLTNKYEHILYFRNIKQCQEDYISYPNWVFKFNIGNWMKRSKIWALYRCQK